MATLTQSKQDVIRIPFRLWDQSIADLSEDLSHDSIEDPNWIASRERDHNAHKIYHRVVPLAQLVVDSDSDLDLTWAKALTAPGWEARSKLHHKSAAKSTEGLRQRLANANDYFRRKASAVVSDEAALRLLAGMYQDTVVEISDFDSCEDGIPMAKLTAANFCEIGENVIYITEAGQRAIEAIEGA